MKSAADYFRIGIAICLVTVCLLTAWESARHVYFYLFHARSKLDALFGLAMLSTWGCLAIGGIGLFRRQRWAYWLIYVAAILNLMPGFVLVPFVGRIVSTFVAPGIASPLLVFGVNGLVLAMLVVSHATMGRINHAA